MGNDPLELLLDGFPIGFVETLLVDGFFGLADARDDSGDGGEEAQGEAEVGGASHVVGDGEGGGYGGGEVGGEEVEDVEADGEADEGDGEVDRGGVDGLFERVLGLAGRGCVSWMCEVFGEGRGGGRTWCSCWRPCLLWVLLLVLASKMLSGRRRVENVLLRVVHRTLTAENFSGNWLKCELCGRRRQAVQRRNATLTEGLRGAPNIDFGHFRHHLLTSRSHWSPTPRSTNRI